MTPIADLNKLDVTQFAERFRSESIPLGNTFAYFCAAVPMAEEDLKEYLEEPIAALPPEVVSRLPRVFVLLVPFLERVNGKNGAHARDLVSMEKPPENRTTGVSVLENKEDVVLAFAVKDREMAEYHYTFYRTISRLLSDHPGDETRTNFDGLLREELNGHVHGEVDEDSWHLKQGLMRRQSGARRDSKPFRAYARQSFIDTMTLYLHGICCDIDVDTGPRQLPSRYLRRRLKLLETSYPPPAGYAVFPEDLHE